MQGYTFSSENFTTADVSPEEAKDLLSRAIEELQGKVEYADGLYERVDGVSIYKDKVEERISTPATANGVVLRAYKLGQWREQALSTVQSQAFVKCQKDSHSSSRSVGTSSS